MVVQWSQSRGIHSSAGRPRSTVGEGTGSTNAEGKTCDPADLLVHGDGDHDGEKPYASKADFTADLLTHAPEEVKV